MQSPIGRIHEIDRMIGGADAATKDRSPAVKLAICPEHYLANKDGSTSGEHGGGRFFNTINEVVPMLKALKQLSDKYPDWLIIPGTVTVLGLDTIRGRDMTMHNMIRGKQFGEAAHVSQFAKDRSEELTAHKQQRLREIQGRPEEEFRPCYNLSPIYFGGLIKTIRRKQYEALGSNESLDRVGTEKDSLFFPLVADNMIFEHDGLRIGVEICGEHEYGGMAHAAGDRPLDIHVIISNDVSPFREHATLAPGGLLVQSDAKRSGVYSADELPGAEDDPAYKHEDTPGIYVTVAEVGA